MAVVRSSVRIRMPGPPAPSIQGSVTLGPSGRHRRRNRRSAAPIVRTVMTKTLSGSSWVTSVTVFWSLPRRYSTVMVSLPGRLRRELDELHSRQRPWLAIVPERLLAVGAAGAHQRRAVEPGDDVARFETGLGRRTARRDALDVGADRVARARLQVHLDAEPGAPGHEHVGMSTPGSMGCVRIRMGGAPGAGVSCADALAALNTSPSAVIHVAVHDISSGLRARHCSRG